MDALAKLREKGIVFSIERTQKEAGDKVLDSWAAPVRTVTKEEARGAKRRAVKD